MFDTFPLFNPSSIIYCLSLAELAETSVVKCKDMRGVFDCELCLCSTTSTGIGCNKKQDEIGEGLYVIPTF